MLLPPPQEGDPATHLRKTPFKVDGWLVRPTWCTMASETEVRQLEPKVMAVLACLAVCPGEPVHRETFMKVVWADVVVTDDALTRCIVELRKVFNDDARQSRVIETMPRVGYRLLVPVEPVTATELASAHAMLLPALHRPNQNRRALSQKVFSRRPYRKWGIGGFCLVGTTLLALGLWGTFSPPSFYDLTGHITDASTGMRLPGVVIHLVDKPGESVANLEGRYHLRVPAGAEEVQVSFVGYIPQSIALKEGQTRLDILLEPRTGFIKSLD